MNIVWVVVVLLTLLLYAGYKWKIFKKFSSLWRAKLMITRHNSNETETSSRQPSIYSLSKGSLSAPKDEFKRPISAQPLVSNPRVPHTAFPVLANQLQELATQAWTTEQSFQSPLLLNPSDFGNISAPAQVVEVLIRHARRTTPGFNVPHMVPRIQVVSLTAAAGMFKVDEEGWVTIQLGTNFFQDKLAAQAILAHEVCHYILENSGIYKSDVDLNERYTDLCMFVCGFGELFLAGYRRDPAQQDYRLGHRLGYLTDDEYRFAQQYVIQLRQSGEISPPKELDVLKKRLLSLLYGDQNSCSRNIEFERRRSPHKSEGEIYQDAIDRLERDRGR
ncbi:MAG: hypothetical protein ACOYN8_08865 [Pseudanabaena sp.]|jgi:hypothetical protein